MKMVLQACLIMLIGSVQYTYSMEGPTAETASEGFLGVLPDDLRNLLNKYLESAGTLDEAVRNVGSIMVLRSARSPPGRPRRRRRSRPCPRGTC